MIVIRDAIISPGRTGFYFDDQAAIKQGNWEEDGFTYRGDPVTSGFSQIRQAGEAVSVQLILDNGQIAVGDCAAVQYSGTGGRDPLFLATDYIPVIQRILDDHFVNRQWTSFRSMCSALEELRKEDDTPYHTAIRYGISQSFLDAVAKSQGAIMAEVAAAEYEQPLLASPIPIFTQSGDDRYLNVDRMILKHADVLPHGLFNNLRKKVGTRGELLLQYIQWLTQRIAKLGQSGYLPTLHVDVYGTLGEAFPETDELVSYLLKLGEASSPHPLRVEGPVDVGSRTGQIEALAEITEAINQRGGNVEIVADEWCNTLPDIEAFARAGAGHVIQIKTPDLGGIHNSMEAVLACRAYGVGAYLGGTCNETDRSAQVCVHAAAAVRPLQMLAKPGMGVDEGFTIVYNEMQRILAYLQRKEQLRANR